MGRASFRKGEGTGRLKRAPSVDGSPAICKREQGKIHYCDPERHRPKNAASRRRFITVPILGRGPIGLTPKHCMRTGPVLDHRPKLGRLRYMVRVWAYFGPSPEVGTTPVHGPTLVRRPKLGRLQYMVRDWIDIGPSPKNGTTPVYGPKLGRLDPSPEIGATPEGAEPGPTLDHLPRMGLTRSRTTIGRQGTRSPGPKGIRNRACEPKARGDPRRSRPRAQE